MFGAKLSRGRLAKITVLLRPDELTITVHGFREDGLAAHPCLVLSGRHFETGIRNQRRIAAMRESRDTRREEAALARWNPRPRWYHPLIGRVVILTSRFIMTKMNKLSIEGRERFEALMERDGRGLLTYSNHVSLFDDPLLAANIVRGPYSKVRWVGADAINFFGNGFKAWLFTAGRSVPIMRGSGLDQPGMHFLSDRLKAGEWVHLLPEGGRTREDAAQMRDSFKAGIGMLVAEAKPLALPFYHYGMQNVLPVGAVRPRSGNEVRMVFGEAINCDDAWIAGVTAKAGPEGDTDTWRAIAAELYAAEAALERTIHPAFADGNGSS
jgi:monolysocardiolipin acyltransferase